MSIAARLPAMTLNELKRLEANATRLAAGAPGRQREEAAALVPLLHAEIEGRRVGKKRTAPKAPKEGVVREAKPRAKRAPKVPATEAEKADRLVAGIDEALARR